MTEPVYILGGWQSDFAERAGEGGFYQLLESATLGALEDSGLMPADIEVAHLGNLAGELTSFQAQLGGLLVSIDPAFNGLPTSRHEAACASGSLAGMAASAEIEVPDDARYVRFACWGRGEQFAWPQPFLPT